MSYFYSHLVNIESVLVDLDELDLDDRQRQRLAEIIDSTVHLTVMDLILEELNEEDKRLFLKHLALGRHDQIWELLNSRVDNIEEKIKQASESLKLELKKDIKSAKEVK